MHLKEHLEINLANSVLELLHQPKSPHNSLDRHHHPYDSWMLMMLAAIGQGQEFILTQESTPQTDSRHQMNSQDQEWA
jgi:hypothetical protein